MEIGQNDHIPTSEKIAKEYNIGEATVRRAEKFTNAIDIIAENTNQDIKNKILKQEIRTTDDEVLQLAKLEPEKQKKIVEKINEGEIKTIKEAIKEEKKEERQSILIEKALELPAITILITYM